MLISNSKKETADQLLNKITSSEASEV